LKKWRKEGVSKKEKKKKKAKGNELAHESAGISINKKNSGICP
jgi:hypothetical protein